MIFQDDFFTVAKQGYLRGRFESAVLADLEILNQIRKLVTRYKSNKLVNIRLLLNSLILFFNCFAPEQARYLLAKTFIEYTDRSILKTCLIFLNYMSDDYWFDVTINVELDILIKESISRY